MPAPLALIGAAGWAIRGVQAYRAARAAKLAAEAAKLAAVTGAAATVSQTMNEARTDADEQAGVTTDYCATCSDPKCRDQGKKIQDRRDELQKRYDEMREDPKDLYRNHYDTPHPDGYGTWVGHVEQFQAKQANLRRLIREYEALGNCPRLDGDHWRQATRDPPSQPAPK